MADSLYIDSCLNLSTLATCLQRPLSSVPKVAVTERFNHNFLKFPHTIVLVASIPMKLLYAKKIMIIIIQITEEMPVITSVIRSAFL